jgi:hypothetical protein
MGSNTQKREPSWEMNKVTGTLTIKPEIKKKIFLLIFNLNGSN